MERMRRKPKDRVRLVQRQSQSGSGVLTSRREGKATGSQSKCSALAALRDAPLGARAALGDLDLLQERGAGKVVEKGQDLDGSKVGITQLQIARRRVPLVPRWLVAQLVVLHIAHAACNTMSHQGGVTQLCPQGEERGV